MTCSTGNIGKHQCVDIRHIETTHAAHRLNHQTPNCIILTVACCWLTVVDVAAALLVVIVCVAVALALAVSGVVVVDGVGVVVNGVVVELVIA